MCPLSDKETEAPWRSHNKSLWFKKTYKAGLRAEHVPRSHDRFSYMPLCHQKHMWYGEGPCGRSWNAGVGLHFHMHGICTWVCMHFHVQRCECVCVRDFRGSVSYLCIFCTTVPHKSPQNNCG